MLTMDPYILQLIGIGVVITLGAVLQSAAGFAYGLFAIPILLWMDLGLPESIAVVCASTTVQTLFGAWHLRREIKWRPVAQATVLRSLFIPLGILLLCLIEGSAARQHVKQIVGGVLLAVVCVQWMWKVEPRERLHAGWSFAAFSISGVMVGLLGMGGPPVVLWVMAQKWSNPATRAFFFLTFLTGTVLQLVMLYLAFGAEVLRSMVTGAAFTPLVLVGSAVGLGIGDRIPKPRLRTIAYVLLTLIAISSMVSPLIRPG